MLTPGLNPDALFEACADRGVDPAILEAVASLAVEIAREGREGRKVGTMFVVGDAEAVLSHSRPLVLDPLLGHPAEVKHVDDPGFRETVKELAQLDGAFVVSSDGVAISAARYLDVSSEGIVLPLGLGSRHVAAAAITRRTDAVAVVASESAVVRMFVGGEIVAEILPEVWLLRRYAEAGFLGGGARRERSGDGSLVASRPPGIDRAVQLTPPVSERDHRLGPDDAPVTLVMYGDYECPYCARAYPRIRALLDEEDGAVRFVYRHFPLRRHPHAQLAAEAAEAAGAQGRYWAMHDLLTAHHDLLDPERIDALAAEAGLDGAQFREDLDTHAFADHVEADYRSGLRSGVEATPTLFVNGIRYTGSHQPDALRAAIESARATR